MSLPISTFSIVVGTKACDAACPFCVSSMTGFDALPKSHDINILNFDKAARLAQMGGTTTVLMTGKGEPTLYPNEVNTYLELLKPFGFPLIEIQTNAMRIGHLAADTDGGSGPISTDTLKDWRKNGLNTIAISVVDVLREHNTQVYHHDYPDLAMTIKFLHGLGFSVRLCVMMRKGFVDGQDGIDRVVSFCKENDVEQLTVRPIRKPLLPVLGGDKASWYVQTHGLDEGQIVATKDYVASEGTHLLTLMHGNHAARIYDLRGQNICISDCLTIEPDSNEIRTLIFYSDGRVMYSWEHDGARIL